MFKPEQLNFVHTVNVTTSTVTSQPTWTTLTIENQPEHHVQTVFGEVKEGELNRIYFDISSIYIPNVGVGGDSTILVEDGVDTTVPTRTITAKEPDYIQCSTNTFTVGKVKSFTMVKSCFDVGSVVKSLNGGTEINIRNISASLSGDSTAASVPFEVNINKFGNQDVQFDLKLDTFLTFNA